MEHTYTPLEEAMRHFVCQKIKAKVTSEKENGLYDVDISTKNPHTEFHISIAPLQMPTLKKNIGDKLLFENVPLSKLSEFYVINIEDNEGESEKEVIKIPTEGVPETRDDEIFRSIVDTKEKFYNYCMAHVRRKFTDAQSSPQTEIGYIRLLYELKVNLKAGEASPEETASERQAKTIGNGGKNYLFYKNDRGDEDNTVFYSQLESCRIVGIN